MRQRVVVPNFLQREEERDGGREGERERGGRERGREKGGREGERREIIAIIETTSTLRAAYRKCG